MLSSKIVGFCGYPGSGKDEAASVLVKHGWQRIAFADKLRAVVLAIDPYVAMCPPVGPEPDETDMEISVFDEATLKILKLGDKSEPMNMVNTIRMQRLSMFVRDFGWDRAKKIPEVRRLLQRMGTEAGRGVLGDNLWVDAAEKQIEIGKQVVFTDVRFPNEAAMIHSRGGKLFWMERPGVDRVNAHSSEDYPFKIDGHILNDGTPTDLHNKILELVGISL